MTGAFQFLIVEDDPIFLAVAESIVRSLGHQRIQTASNGEAARLALSAAQGHFDFIILDLNMPGADGLSFLRSASAAGFRGGIIISSSETDSVLRSARSLGQLLGLDVLGCLRKPLDPAELQALLRGRQAPATAADAPGQPVVERVAGVRQLTLEPFYQSQHRTRDRSLYGIEALIRGRGADGRVHGPGSVLGPADRAGNTLEVNLAIVDSILADMAVWRRAGAQPRMSINLDARMAEVETVADSLLALAARHAVPTASLCLELTETALPNDMTRLVESLTRLRIAGFELSLDDYGTGGSNFEILRLCPFSELKIDGPILRTAVTEPVARRFVESAVQMARDLSMEVVAEGVESPAHLDLVRQLGIDVVQGFLLCRPMPAAEMLARITRVQPLARAS